MTIKNIVVISLLIIISLSFSCNKSNPPEPDAVAATLSDYTGLDGCSWVIKLQNNQVLEPVNLGEFDIELEEGKKIWIKYTIAESMASICMVGQMVEIEAIWER